MNGQLQKKRVIVLIGALVVLELIAASIAAPAEIRLAWAGRPGAVDRSQYPTASQPGCFDVEIATPHLISGGELGFVVRDPNGLLSARLEPVGRRGADGESTAPVQFRCGGWESGRIRMPFRIGVGGEAGPLRIEIAWATLETPAGADTIVWGTEVRPRLTVLGGEFDAPCVPVVHAVAPRCARAGGRLTLLGDGLDRVAAVVLLAADNSRLPAVPDGPRESGRSRWILPDHAAAGPYALLLDGRPLPCGGIRIERGRGESLQEPLWSPGDGDLLVVVADHLAGAVGVYTDDLRSRGYRPACTRMSLILRDYGDDDRSDSIRRAISDAYASFSTRPLALVLVGTASEDDPGGDRLPTRHLTYDHEFPGSFDSTCADDGEYGDLVDGLEGSAELIVGRIPARTPAELTAYTAKLAAYRSQPQQPRLLFVVGDAAINRDNSDRRRAAAELAAIASNETSLSLRALLASSYMPLSLQVNRQRAHDDFMAELAGGIGVLEIFGNNTGAIDIAHMLEAPPSANLPCVHPSQMPTQGRLPIVLFHTCLNGAFDEDSHFPGYDAPVETWVREPQRGVIAAIAQSHLTEFFDDSELASQIVRRLGAGDAPTLGAIHAGVRSCLLAESARGSRSAASVRMANLLGDPLLTPRLGVETVSLDGSFESSSTWTVQNSVEQGRGWTTPDLDPTCASARIVHSGVLRPECGVGPATPVEAVHGDRMLRLEARFVAGQTRRAVAWRIFDCDVEIREGSRLRYIVRQDLDRRGVGSLSVDAVTASGRILSQDLRDATGLPADPRRYRYTLGSWHPILVRLDAWAGERIVALFARYEDDGGCDPVLPAEMRGGARSFREDPMPAGTILGAIDQLRIEPGPSGPLADPIFEIDEDGDGSPDFWSPPAPGNAANGPARGLALRDEGVTALYLTQGAAEGAMQLLGPRSRPDLPLRLFLEARSVEMGKMRIAITDPESGTILDSAILGPLADRWSQYCVELMTPDPGPGALLLSAAEGTAGVRALHHSDYEAPLPREVLPPPRPVLRIGPNPTAGTIFLEAEGVATSRWTLDLFDLSGRRRASGLLHLRPGEMRRVDLRSLGLRDTGAAVYCLRLRTDSVTFTRMLGVVR